MPKSVCEESACLSATAAIERAEENGLPLGGERFTQNLLAHEPFRAVEL
jgi:hypothetical protein